MRKISKEVLSLGSTGFALVYMDTIELVTRQLFDLEAAQHFVSKGQEIIEITL